MLIFTFVGNPVIGAPCDDVCHVFGPLEHGDGPDETPGHRLLGGALEPDGARDVHLHEQLVQRFRILNV